MNNWLRALLVLVGIGCSAPALAVIECSGRIYDVYKWNHMTTLSIRIVLPNGTITNYISMPTKSDEAMALMALAQERAVRLVWAASDITACVNGWDHNRSLEGYFLVPSTQ